MTNTTGGKPSSLDAAMAALEHMELLGKLRAPPALPPSAVEAALTGLAASVDALTRAVLHGIVTGKLEVHVSVLERRVRAKRPRKKRSS